MLPLLQVCVGEEETDGVPQEAVWKNWKLQKRNWKPKVSAEFMTFWLHRFRKLDLRQKSHRKMLIDTFINAVFLYDDKMAITFNYKEGTKTIAFGDLKTALDKEAAGSDLDRSTAPSPENIAFSGLQDVDKVNRLAER